MENPNFDFDLKYATVASRHLATGLKATGLNIIDLRITTGEVKQATREVMEMAQARVDSFFSAFDNLPRLPFTATEKDDPTEMRVVPLGSGVTFAKYDIQSEEHILGRTYPTVIEALVAFGPSFTAAHSLASRTIAIRTQFTLEDSPPNVSTFSPNDRIRLMGYGQAGYRDVPRLEFTRFGNGKEIVGLFRTGADHDIGWVTPCLGTPAHRHDYLVKALGLDRMNIDQKDFFIMFMQIAEEHSRFENLRLRQELDVLKQTINRN